MTNKMRVLKGAGVSADTLEIIVTKGEEEVFYQKLYYGYNVSWKKEFATEQKPYDKDLIEQVAKQYGLPLKEVEYGEGVRLTISSYKE